MGEYVIFVDRAMFWRVTRPGLRVLRSDAEAAGLDPGRGGSGAATPAVARLAEGEAARRGGGVRHDRRVGHRLSLTAASPRPTSLRGRFHPRLCTRGRGPLTPDEPGAGSGERTTSCVVLHAPRARPPTRAPRRRPQRDRPRSAPDRGGHGRPRAADVAGPLRARFDHWGALPRLTGGPPGLHLAPPRWGATRRGSPPGAPARDARLSAGGAAAEYGETRAGPLAGPDARRAHVEPFRCAVHRAHTAGCRFSSDLDAGGSGSRSCRTKASCHRYRTLLPLGVDPPVGGRGVLPPRRPSRTAQRLASLAMDLPGDPGRGRSCGAW